MKINGFSEYYFINGKVYRNGKEIKLCEGKNNYRYYNMKSDNGKYKQVSKTKILKLCGIKTLKLPKNAKKIPFIDGEYYIDTDGNVYSFQGKNHNGKKLKTYIGSKGYLRVKIGGKLYDLHNLMARVFLMENYSEKGLCCMHLDNDKTNCKLSNLKIGTYSENNKSAYKDGLNKGNYKGINQYNK